VDQAARGLGVCRVEASLSRNVRTTPESVNVNVKVQFLPQITRPKVCTAPPPEG